jgi:hypothetical protein
MHDPVRSIDQEIRGRRHLKRFAMQSGLAESRPRAPHSRRQLNGLVQAAYISQQPGQQARLFSRLRGRLVDASLSVMDTKQSLWIVGRLGRSENQKVARIQGIMESAADLLLEFAVEINEEVPAGDEVNVRERRVFEHAVVCEDEEVAQLTPHSIMIALVHEVPAEPFLADIRCDRGRISALPGEGERPDIEIRCEYLNGRMNVMPAPSSSNKIPMA